VTPSRGVVAPPGLVLRRAILVWGLGDLTLGDRPAAIGWLLAEALGLVVLAVITLSLANSTWYLVPFLLGAGFIGLWAFQAMRAFRRAAHRQGATPPTPRRSPAAAMAWLTVPILLWGTGFWMIGAEGASPSAVLDRFVSEWPALASAEPGWRDGFAADSAELTTAARATLSVLRDECQAGRLATDCDQATTNLLRDVRVSVVSQSGDAATAVAELVDYQKRATSVLWLFQGSELVPVSRQKLLELDLRTVGVPLLGMDLGARRWQVAEARVLGP
jgi:hypothetical protein